MNYKKFLADWACKFYMSKDSRVKPLALVVECNVKEIVYAKYIVLCSACANFPQYIVGLSSSSRVAVASAQDSCVLLCLRFQIISPNGSTSVSVASVAE